MGFSAQAAPFFGVSVVSQPSHLVEGLMLEKVKSPSPGILWEQWVGPFHPQVKSAAAGRHC